ncbi:type VII secretion-associated serine protease mycosin [Actinoplanes sp. NPDC051346]|uniref:type VII secretion-associated serine protease mycosin n=1 Tax=Actinoplanes sp. NPDC051346 TaxID=3155048 RepID=UPI003412289A
MRLPARVGHVVAVVASLSLVGWTAAPAAADSVRERQWHLSALKISEAHQATRGAGITVALIDSGVDTQHRDLTGAILPGKDFESSDGDGREDLIGHGTNLAGIIAGRGHGEGSGVLGVAPAAKIIPIRVAFDSFVSGTQVVDAIEFAADHGAQVINMSFSKSDDPVIREAIRAAQAKDIVVIAGAGNRDDGGDHYPGRYPEVLSVGAVDRSGKIGDFSVTGPHVDLVAPGVDICTTGINDSGYVVADGTSHATAVVSGAAALVRAEYPELSAAEVVHRLTATAVDSGARGRDDVYGYGRLDLVKALTADVPALPKTVATSAVPERVPGAGAESKRVSPIVLASGLAAVVLLLGGVVVVLMIRRR